jgi:antitoxin (DNA-binding transcriptional repressor) of toxin-antitoxin stability system
MTATDTTTHEAVEPTTIEVADARLEDLLERVSRGERVVLTEGGLARATIGPPARDQAKIDAALEFFRESRKKYSIEGLSIREMIDEGRR